MALLPPWRRGGGLVVNPILFYTSDGYRYWKITFHCILNWGDIKIKLATVKDIINQCFKKITYIFHIVEVHNDIHI